RGQHLSVGRGRRHSDLCRGHDGRLFCLDAASGRTLWHADIGATLQSSPTVAGGVVFLGARNNAVMAFDESTGRRLWTSSTGAPVDASVAVSNNMVFVASGGLDPKLLAFRVG